MKTLAAVLFFLAALTPPAIATEPFIPAESRTDECRPGALISADPTILAQRGCCSWHGGICGCYGIRIACCDGTLSPSCLCRGGSPPSEPEPLSDAPNG